MKEPSGNHLFDKVLQLLVYDDIGDGIISATDGAYVAGALTLFLGKVKKGATGYKLVKKLFKHGTNNKLPTPKLNPEQFEKVAGKQIHKKTGAIYTKSHTSHGNKNNTGTQWKVWPKGTKDFGKTSKTTGTRVTVDGEGNVIGN